MSDLARPPLLSSRAVSCLLLRFFPFREIDSSSINELVSYDDRNYFFRGARLDHEAGSRDSPTGQYVLKVTNRNDPPELIAELSEIMHVLHQKGYKCPYPIPTRAGGGDLMVISSQQLHCLENGGDEVKLTAISGHTENKEDQCLYAVRVLVFVPGEMLSDVPQSPLLMFKVGQYIGSLDRDLQGYSHKLVDNRVYEMWDMQVLLNCRRLLSSIHDPHKRQMLEQVFDSFEECITPNIPTYKQGIIHNDPNDMNILVQKDDNGEYSVYGIIDFGDCMRSCYLFELAIAMAYSMCSKENPVHFSLPLLAGYLSEFPLPEHDLQYLYWAVLGRLAQSCANGEHNYQQEPTNEYLLVSARPAWKVIATMLEMGKAAVDQVWAKARGKTSKDFS